MGIAFNSVPVGIETLVFRVSEINKSEVIQEYIHELPDAKTEKWKNSMANWTKS